MWFKTLSVYRIVDGDFSADQLDQGARQLAFQPCGPYTKTTCGFVSPWSEGSELYTHTALDCHRLRFRREERKLPGAAVKAEVSKRARALIDEEQVEKVTKDLLKTLKKQVEDDLLPKVLPWQKDVDFYVDNKNRIVVIDDTSAKRCDEIMSCLRKINPESAFRALMPAEDVSEKMNTWVSSGDLPLELEIGEKCQLHHHEEGVITYRTDFSGDEKLRTYLVEDGFALTSLELLFDGLLQFDLTTLFVFKSVKTQDGLLESLDGGEYDDEDAYNDAIFSLMVEHYGALIEKMLCALGGEMDWDTAAEPASSGESGDDEEAA